MTIKARILLDSVNPVGNRLTTWELTYPRFIHSEFMTHRVFSRNAASSRAIPITKMIQRIKDDTAQPVHWGKNQRGMQADEELPEEVQDEALVVWEEARDLAIGQAQKLIDLGIHKQVANRLLEPFAHMVTICTGTEFSNFFALRAHPMAQPEFGVLAAKMKTLYEESEPRKLRTGDWHLPLMYPEDFRTIEEKYPYLVEASKHICAARCARVSYLTHDGKRDLEKDLELYRRLRNAIPPHASAFEHAAMSLPVDTFSGNFRGWLQYRKELGF